MYLWKTCQSRWKRVQIKSSWVVSEEAALSLFFPVRSCSRWPVVGIAAAEGDASTLLDRISSKLMNVCYCLLHMVGLPELDDAGFYTYSKIAVSELPRVVYDKDLET